MLLTERAAGEDKSLHSTSTWVGVRKTSDSHKQSLLRLPYLSSEHYFILLLSENMLSPLFCHQLYILISKHIDLHHYMLLHMPEHLIYHSTKSSIGVLAVPAVVFVSKVYTELLFFSEQKSSVRRMNNIKHAWLLSWHSSYSNSLCSVCVFSCSNMSQ